MKASIKVAQAAGCLMGISKPVKSKSEAPQGKSSSKARVGDHCSSSVSFMRRTYQQTRLVLTQHNLDAPSSDEEDPDSEEEEGEKEDAPGPSQREPSKSSLSRQSTKSSMKATKPHRKDMLWGKVKAMFEGTRLAIQHREKVLDQVRLAVQETVERRNASKRMQEALKSAGDVSSVLSLVDASIAAEFRDIMEDALRYQTLDHLAFARNVIAAVLGEAQEAQDQASFDVQDSLLDATQEAAAGDESREQELESLMCRILAKVDALKEKMAAAREAGWQQASSAASQTRSLEEEQLQPCREAPQEVDDILVEEAAAPKPVTLLPAPPDRQSPEELHCRGPSPPCEEEVSGAGADAGAAASERCEPRFAEEPGPMPRSAAPPGSRAPASPAVSASPSVRARRHVPQAEPRARRQVSTETALPAMTAKETHQRHAESMDSFFQAPQRDAYAEDAALKREQVTAACPMIVVGQARLPSPVRGKRGGGCSRPRFPVMPMFPVAEAKKTTERPSTGLPPCLSLEEGTLQSSWSFSKNAGSGRFDYALAALPVSQIVRRPVVRQEPPTNKRQTPPSSASSVTDWFPLPSIPGLLEDEDDP